MTVYVDNAYIQYRNMSMCHMVADNIDELHVMADKIGIDRKHFQNTRIPHYDICQNKRKIAINFGAHEITTKELVKLAKP